MNQKTKQSEKARLGAIGENLVVTKLMQQGWDAFNANCTIKNFRSIDIICIDGNSTDPKEFWKPNMALVQVKTSFQQNIPVGFTISQCLDKEYLEKNVMGPYVFVSAKKNNEDTYSFKYFILSRSMLINLLYEAHKHYIYEYNRIVDQEKQTNNEYINGIKVSSPAGLFVRWLMGESDKQTSYKSEFRNPLNGISCEDEWNNIWLP